jgi:TRAP-type C4-dicarboxylate transport system substrate-binding protein
MTIKRLLFAFLTLGFCLCAEAQTIVIKLATVAPKDSAWYEYLQEIDRGWREASGGTVRLKIYAGTLGDEEDIMRRIRIGQLDAATVSTAGLSTVDEAATALHIPLAFANYEELDYVQARIAGELEGVLKKKELIVLNWGDAGWVHLFAQAPVERPEDLRKQKLFVWGAGNDTAEVELWKRLGFHPVALSTVDIMPALQTGMITAYEAPPLAALANQWFGLSLYMTDIKWAPLTGATVIAERSWSRVDPALRPRLKHIAEVAGERLRDKVRALEREAIEAMTKRGLHVVAVSPEARQEWTALAQSAYPLIRNTIVPAKYFDEVVELRDEFRAGGKKLAPESRRPLTASVSRR